MAPSRTRSSFGRLLLQALVPSGYVTAVSPVSTVPKYVLDYAPLVHIYSQDAWQPSDIMNQLVHTHPTIDFKNVTGAPSPLTLSNLNQLNALGGSSVYLSSNNDFTRGPKWLHGIAPNSAGKTVGATSSAIIVHNKGNAVIDAYYMYFYAYNQGNTVLETQELGDHVGDWEHNMIRFRNGKPRKIWYSQHSSGAAYTWSAVEKRGSRPLAYSGNGTHASWATAGSHEHSLPDVILPQGFLVDYTDNGPLWDPTLSAYFYSVNYPNNINGDDTNPTFAALPNPTEPGKKTPVNWLYFKGQWGDDQLPKNDPRQVGFFFNVTYKYTAGPNGPRFKGLNRIKVCPNGGPPCIVRKRLLPGA